MSSQPEQATELPTQASIPFLALPPEMRRYFAIETDLSVSTWKILLKGSAVSAVSCDVLGLGYIECLSQRNNFVAMLEAFYGASKEHAMNVKAAFTVALKAEIDRRVTKSFANLAAAHGAFALSPKEVKEATKSEHEAKIAQLQKIVELMQKIKLEAETMPDDIEGPFAVMYNTGGDVQVIRLEL